MRLSVTPSTKCSCSGSPPILANGRTTIERRGGPCLFGSETDSAGDVPCAAGLDRIDPHRPRDVFQVLLAEIDEIRIDFAAHMIVCRTREQHAARLADAFEPRRDIDAVAENVVALDQDVAEVDADAIDDALVLGVSALRSTISFWIAIAHSTAATMEGNSSSTPVARRLDDAPAEARDDRPCRLAMLADRPRRPRLVLAHQARVADDVGGEDRGEAAGGGHCSGTPALRRPSKIGSSWARYVGSSLIAVQAARARETEKVGLSARPALTAESRLVQSAKLREGGGQTKICCRKISVGLDRPSKPRRPPAPNCRLGSSRCPTLVIQR